MKKSYKDDSFGSRIANAAKARQAVLARIKAQPGPGDPEFDKIKEERQAAITARNARLADRKAEIEKKLAREKTEREARLVAKQQAEKKIADEAVELLAAQKAARDARYAARKARKGKKSRGK
ncbi:MAG: hypothetical protein CMM58_00625 [Rhodospirillaceae bacterium]|nr:hypothetical protein [Rhodospirillaceae bacterium]|tara:strand:+ start:460 stop:828 length:369 start_codon:yes stop_codon:yes gene_type:complete